MNSITLFSIVAVMIGLSLKSFGVESGIIEDVYRQRGNYKAMVPRECNTPPDESQNGTDHFGNNGNRDFDCFQNLMNVCLQLAQSRYGLLNPRPADPSGTDQRISLPGFGGGSFGPFTGAFGPFKGSSDPSEGPSDPSEGPSDPYNNGSFDPFKGSFDPFSIIGEITKMILCGPTREGDGHDSFQDAFDFEFYNDNGGMTDDEDDKKTGSSGEEDKKTGSSGEEDKKRAEMRVQPPFLAKKNDNGDYELMDTNYRNHQMVKESELSDLDNGGWLEYCSNSNVKPIDVIQK